MKPDKEYEYLYKNSIVKAKNVFGKYFTCRMGIAPHGEEFEVAVIPIEAKRKWNNVQVCLVQMPAIFMTAYLRKGKKKVLAIETRSGGIRELWEMVKEIMEPILAGDIVFKSYNEGTEAPP